MAVKLIRFLDIAHIWVDVSITNIPYLDSK